MTIREKLISVSVGFLYELRADSRIVYSVTIPRASTPSITNLYRRRIGLFLWSGTLGSESSGLFEASMQARVCLQFIETLRESASGGAHPEVLRQYSQ